MENLERPEGNSGFEERGPILEVERAETKR